MRKKILCMTLLMLGASNALAIDGFGNVKFMMTSKQVEAKGYVCASDPVLDNKILCQHPHLKNSAYGYIATNYKVIFSTDKKISQISAELRGINSSEEYFELLRKISILFPIIDRDKEVSGRRVFVRNVRRNQSHVGAAVSMLAGVPGIRGATVTLSYIPPEVMLQLDKRREEPQASTPNDSEVRSESDDRLR